MESEETARAAEGFGKSVGATAEAMRGWLSNLDTITEQTEFSKAFVFIYYRALAWLQSLARLDKSLHLQAIATANRSLLEAVVDLILLQHDKSGISPHKYIFWGESASLKIAEGAIGYYNLKKQPIPERFLSWDKFVAEEKDRINIERMRLRWIDPKACKGKHPDRWTCRDLGSDCKRADETVTNLANGVAGSSIILEEIGTSLTEIYETEYRRINLLVHASGYSPILNAPADILDGTEMLYKHSCDELAVLIVRIVMMEFGFAEAPRFQTELRNLKKRQKEMRASGLPRR